MSTHPIQSYLLLFKHQKKIKNASHNNYKIELVYMMSGGICLVLDEVNVIFIFIFIAFLGCTRCVHVIFNTLIFSAHISFLDFVIFRRCRSFALSCVVSV